jgi:hypothetical protein
MHVIYNDHHRRSITDCTVTPPHIVITIVEASTTISNIFELLATSSVRRSVSR